MKITISFLHLEHTDSLDDRIREKSEKLVKYMDGAKLSIKWHCYAKETDHCADVTVSGPKMTFHASGHTDCLYKTIDHVMEKLEKQLCKHKEKTKNRRSKHKAELIIVDPDMAWTDYNEFDESA